ncbi:ATP-binding protein [Thermodesulfobacteriota bacterium]
MVKKSTNEELGEKIKKLERKALDYQQALKALNESEERYHLLADFSYDLVTWRGTDGRYIYVSPSCEKITGYTQDQFIHDSLLIEKIAHPKDKEAIIEHFKDGFCESEIDHIDFRIITRKGEEKWISHYCRPVYGSDGSYIGRRTSNRDITKRKQVEEALKESSKKIKMFAYSVSHDLKGPAIGLYGITKRLHKDYVDILDDKGQKYCEQILKTTEHIASLVEQVNLFIATKESPLIIERLELKEVLNVIREEFSTQLSIREITWLEPDYIPEIKADRLIMMRILRNLVDNALKYGGEALSEINIGYEESRDSHIFSIKDNGIGLKEQDHHRDIFSPFVRRKTSKGIEGSGLGLNIVREGAKKHGGDVWLEPGQESGMMFHISIPRKLQLSR